MKRLIAPFLIGVLVGAIAVALISCPTSAALKQAKLQYETYRAIATADHAMSLDRIRELERISTQYVEQITTYQVEISARDKTIALQKASIAQNVGQITRLRTEVQPVIDANPALAEFVASLDAGIVLRDNLIIEQEEQIADAHGTGRPQG